MFPTETPTPNLTIIPTETSTATTTPTPTSTPTPEPTPIPIIVSTGPIATAKTPLRLGRSERISEGGFSFQAPLGYEKSYQTNQVTMTSIDEDTVFSLLGGKMDREDDLLADFEQFVDIISATVNDFQANESYEYVVGGMAGLAAEVSGLYGETEVAGRILVVAPADDQIFYALAISPDIDNGEGWEPEGRQAFEAIIRTISFFDPVLPVE